MRSRFTFDDIEATPQPANMNTASGILWEFRQAGRYKCQLFFKDRTTRKQIIAEFHNYQIGEF